MGRRKKKPKPLDWMSIYNSIRAVWTINPKTRVKPNKRKYNRSKVKQEIKKDM